jgi:hypothetical protein
MNKNPLKVPFNLGSAIGGSIPIIIGLIVLCYWMTQPPEARPQFHPVYIKILGAISIVFGMTGNVFYAEMQRQKNKRLEKQRNIQ